MSDLINRQDVIKRAHLPTIEDAGYEVIRLDYVLSLTPAQPEIIRCKDCKNWDTTWQNDFAPNYHYCSLVDGTRRGDFYCADAERRGEQDEIDNCYKTD